MYRNIRSCTRKQFRAKECQKFQGLLFTKAGKKQRLFFNSVQDREAYYAKHLQGRKEYSKFMRYSVMSTRKKSFSQKRSF